MIEKFAQFLRRKYFVVFTDHNCLRWLRKESNVTIPVFDGRLKYKNSVLMSSICLGKHNHLAAVLSRVPSNVNSKVYYIGSCNGNITDLELEYGKDENLKDIIWNL